MLLQRGVDVNAQNWRGQTALHFAFAFLYLALADSLLASGARRDIQNFYGAPRTSPHFAAISPPGVIGKVGGDFGASQREKLEGA
jgi:ankyrin repeat protein